MSKPVSSLIRCIDFSFADSLANVYFDEALFRLADKTPDVQFLRFWQSSSYAIVLGRIGKVEDDLHIEAIKQDHVPVIRRSSGGGTVIQGRGCFNYAFVLSKVINPALDDLKASYAWISERVIEALAKQGVQAVFRPISDLALADNDKKFSGNAQRRGRTHILHHGTILYDFDLALIPHYLKQPKDMPAYRQNRSHLDFVTNIKIQPDRFKADLAAAFGVKVDTKVTDQEAASLNGIIKDIDYIKI